MWISQAYKVNYKLTGLTMMKTSPRFLSSYLGNDYNHDTCRDHEDEDEDH